MKNLFALACATLVLGFTFSSGAAEKLQHVVAFKFKSTAKAEEIQQVEDVFKALKTKIKEVKALEWGTNVSPEKLNKGFTHCWVLTFKSEKDRDAYLVHPEHKAFVNIVGPVLEEAFVIDFWTRK
jgi:hypothetical protein